MWVPANHGAPIDLARIRTNDSLTVAGIVTSYQDNADDPIVWQLVPRTTDDVLITRRMPAWPAWLLWTLIGGGAVALAVLAFARLNSRRHLRTLRETDARYRQLLALSPGSRARSRERQDPLHQSRGGRNARSRERGCSRRATDRRFRGREYARCAGGTGDRRRRAAAHRACAAACGPRVEAALDVEIVSSPCVYHDRPAVVVLARDISAQLRYERDLHALALIDELTGLHNRRGFTLFAEQELARARRHGRVPVLVFADLDDLKGINDLHGHASGDAAIRLVAAAFKSILREADIVARWSGDEFVALLSDGIRPRRGRSTPGSPARSRVRHHLVFRTPSARPSAPARSIRCWRCVTRWSEPTPSSTPGRSTHGEAVHRRWRGSTPCANRSSFTGVGAASDRP